MKLVVNQNILRNHDVSVVSFIRIGEEQIFFDFIRKNYQILKGNGIELIIVANIRSDGDWVELLFYEFPHINWRIISRESNCDQSVTSALNAGVRYAQNQYVLIIDEFYEFKTNIVYQLRYILEYFQNSFSIGQVKSCTERDIFENRNDFGGPILVKKEDFFWIGGFDMKIENFDECWNDLYMRLILFGIKVVKVPEAVSFVENKAHKKSEIETSDISPRLRGSYPKEIYKNQIGWGYGFHETIYSWKTFKNVNYRKLLLARFKKSWLKNDNIHLRHYKIVALMQVRNECDLLPDVLLHLDKYCDAIILLDDGSTDSSFELASSEKLILKVSRSYKGYFDDLENRNLLLELGHLVNADWFIFIDADEKFHENYSEISLVTRLRGFDVISFNLIHLWDSDYMYRYDLPEGSEGILKRYRMFRNCGFSQIIADREVHFPAIPNKERPLHADIVLVHSGLENIAVRERKFRYYTEIDNKEEKQGFSYKYLLDKQVEVRSIKTIPLPKSIFSNLHSLRKSEFNKNKYRIVILVPFYNVSPFIKNSYDSIIEQQYENFDVVFVDMCSKDAGASIIPRDDSKISVYTEKRKTSELEAIISIIKEQNLKEEDIIVIVDGGDYFIHDKVLTELNDIYNSQKCLLTYGQYSIPSGKFGFCFPYSKDQFLELKHQTINRSFYFRSFKYSLITSLEKNNPDFTSIKDKSGVFISSSSDPALMHSLMEVAGYEKAFFVTEPWYVHNLSTQKLFSKLHYKSKYDFQIKYSYKL